jgi:hypothetical protein
MSLLDQSDPEAPENKILILEKRVEALEQRYSELNDLSELTPVLGMQSAQSIDYPAFTADEDGITFPDAGDAINFDDVESHGTISLIPYFAYSGNRSGINILHYLNPGANLITNGDFETGDLTGWTITGGAPVVQSNYVKNGSYALQMALTDYLQSNRISILSNAYYALSIGAMASLTFGISWYTSADAYISSVQGNMLQVATDKWGRMYLIGLAPSNAAYARVFFQNGACYVDDVLFFYVEQPTQLTVGGLTASVNGRDLQNATALNGLDETMISKFGDGSDGNVTINADTTLTRDMYYLNLTINAGKTLYTNGFIVRVARQLLIQGTGTIDSSGKDGTAGGTGNGSGGAGGAGAYTGGARPFLPMPTSGATGEGVTASSTYNGATKITPTPLLNSQLEPYTWMAAMGGAGGAAHGVSDGTTALPAATIAGHRGGNGGAATGTTTGSVRGGGGGGGAGIILIYAYTINNSGTIKANGGKGGNGVTSGSLQSGNGGGGGGGAIIIFYHDASSTLGTQTAAGGAAGTGGNGGTAGVSGVSMAYKI